MLKVSYSGVRGKVGESLTAEVAEKFGCAFEQMLPDNPTVLLARDTRPSGEMLQQALIRGMARAGGRLLDLGVVPTPTLQFAMGPLQAHGAVIVTASHNPHPWNGFKFMLGPDNTVLDGAQTEELMRLVEACGELPSGNGVVREDYHERAVDLHIVRVLEQIDPEPIRARKLRVALDSGLGAGQKPMTRLLHQLGCEVVQVDAVRDSEPLPENLVQLCATVVEQVCDLGMALDLDADRLALVTEQGQAPGEDYTLVLVVDQVLRSHTGPAVVVKNLTTTRAVDEVAARYEARVVETRVGEINLSRALRDNLREGRFAFGGEGNGGVIYPAISLGRDSLMGAALVLEAIAARKTSLSRLLETLPHYHAAKDKLDLDGDLPELYRKLEAAFPEAQPNRMDGLRLFFGDGSWVAVRPSNTEPIVRVLAESPDPEWPQQALQRVRQLR